VSFNLPSIQYILFGESINDTKNLQDTEIQIDPDVKYRRCGVIVEPNLYSDNPMALQNICAVKGDQTLPVSKKKKLAENPNTALKYN
jgi:hypothetical protein